ncbi:MAG: hypothetical protein ABW217_03875 [Polyangiaceae bacterium]
MTETELMHAVHEYAHTTSCNDPASLLYRYDSAARAKLLEAIEVYAGRFRPSDHALQMLRAKAAVCDAWVKQWESPREMTHASTELSAAYDALRELEAKHGNAR